MLLIITSTSDEVFIAVNIDGLEWPWTSKIEGFKRCLCSQFSVAADISRVNCAEITWSRPGQTVCEICSTERAFLPSDCRHFRFKESSVRRPQIWLFLGRRIIILLHAVGYIDWQNRCCRASCELCSHYLYSLLLMIDEYSWVYKKNDSLSA